MSASCEKGHCPEGTTKSGSNCIANADQLEEPSSAGTGEAPPPASGAPAEDTGGSASAGTAPAPAGSGAAGSESAAGAPGVAGSGAAAGAGAPEEPMSTDPCAGRAEGFMCDENVMLRCSGGMTVARNDCSDAVACRVGQSTGSCGVCNPGSFRCTDATLEKCSDAGQFEVAKTCDSAALCSATAGECTDRTCNPNTKVCDPDGTLQTCNEDGTKLIRAERCGAGMCDAKLGRCNQCLPGAARCIGNTAATCSDDGQTETMLDCAAKDECTAARCDDGECVSAPKSRGAACESANICDGEGKCIGCFGDADCSANEVCVQQMCVVKACTPDAATCTSSGTLQICDGTGAKIAMSRQCGQRLCNQAGRTCYKCVPNEATCNGSMLVTCNADGSASSAMPCAPKGECGTASCAGNRCNYGNAPSGKSCNGGRGKCDGTGRCADCLEGERMPCTDLPESECGPGTKTCSGGRWGMCRGTADACERPNLSCRRNMCLPAGPYLDSCTCTMIGDTLDCMCGSDHRTIDVAACGSAPIRNCPDKLACEECGALPADSGNP